MKYIIDLKYKRPEDILPVLDELKYTHGHELTIGEFMVLNDIIDALINGEELNED